MKNYITENNEILTCDVSHRSDKSDASYGNRKAECERVLQNASWLDKVILRPSMVYGRYDPTDRLYYWLYRSHRQTPFILPNEGKDKITLTYVKNLANIITKSIETRTHSVIYNATTHQPVFLRELIRTADGEAMTTCIDSHELIANGVKPGEDIPLWFNNSLMISNEKLLKDFDIELHSFDRSIGETVEYYSDLNWPLPKTGLNLAREEEIIRNCAAKSK